VLVGKVNVPVFKMVDILGLVKVLFVRVCVAVNVTMVSVISGKVIVLFADCIQAKDKVVPVTAPDDTKPIFLVLSALSTTKQEAFIMVLFVRISVVFLPINVSVLVGRVNVPVFKIVEIFGLVNVLFVSVCVAVKVTTVSVISGNVMVLFADCIPAKVKVVLVVAPRDENPIFLVLSVLSTIKHDAFIIVLFVRISVVFLPTKVSVLVGNVSVPVFTIVLIIGLVKVLFVSVSVVFLPINVSVLVGKVNVPVLRIVDIMGLVKVLLVNVCVTVKVTIVSEISGKVMVLLTVCIPAKDKVVPVVAPDDTKPIFLVLSVPST